MDTAEHLQSETKRWFEKIKTVRPTIEIVHKHRVDFLQNIDAYISDAQHFIKNDDWVRAFEAVIWSWSWLEIGERIGILKKK